MPTACLSRYTALSTYKTVVLALERAKNHSPRVLFKDSAPCYPWRSWLGFQKLNSKPACQVILLHWPVDCSWESQQQGFWITCRLNKFRDGSWMTKGASGSIYCRAPFVRRKFFDLQKAASSSDSGSRGCWLGVRTASNTCLLWGCSALPAGTYPNRAQQRDLWDQV